MRLSGAGPAAGSGGGVSASGAVAHSSRGGVHSGVPVRTPRSPTSGSPTLHAVAGDGDLAQRAREVAQALLEHAHRLAQLAVDLQVAQEDQVVAQVADPHLGRAEVAGDGLGLVDEEHGHAHVLEVPAQGVQLLDQVVPREREPVARDPVDHHDAGAALLHLAPHHQRELAGREAQRLHLHHRERARRPPSRAAGARCSRSGGGACPAAPRTRTPPSAPRATRPPS